MEVTTTKKMLLSPDNPEDWHHYRDQLGKEWVENTFTGAKEQRYVLAVEDLEALTELVGTQANIAISGPYWQSGMGEPVFRLEEYEPFGGLE